MALRFDYHEAFERNIGWVTEAEQSVLRSRRVAIAGMGGVGGSHLLTLARFGIGEFSIADFDTFDVPNINRQAGATVDTVGHPKLAVMAAMAMAINPGIQLSLFPDGVTEDGIDDFLAGADLFVDGFDFFAMAIRRKVFARCAELGIPAVTAAPIGMGAGFLAFVPGGMTFEQYFRLDGQPEDEQFLRFLMGVAPRGLHRPYLVDATRVDLAARRGPSTVAACQLCAGVTAVSAVKLLLHRGTVWPAPLHHHFDPYCGRLAVTRLRWGNAGPLQRVRLAVARRVLARPTVPRPAPTARTPIEAVLEAGRWAPSGDNVQPWRFTILGSDRAVVRFAFDAASIYEHRGAEPSVLAGGMLLETLRIAAADLGQALTYTVQGPGAVLIELHAGPQRPDPLSGHVRARSVDRRPYLRRRLTVREIAALEAALGPDLRITWYPERRDRLRIGRLGALATAIRLRAPEGFGTHQAAIDWRRSDSETGIPAGAVGLDRGTLWLMRWALRHWSRVVWVNRLMGTAALSLQLDYTPAFGSAAFFLVRPKVPFAAEPDARLRQLLGAGQALQRFWLTATALGLAMQPASAIISFAHYGAAGVPFTTDAGLRAAAGQLAVQFRHVLGTEPGEALFLGRVGQPRIRRRYARSVRRSLQELSGG